MSVTGESLDMKPFFHPNQDFHYTAGTWAKIKYTYISKERKKKSSSSHGNEKIHFSFNISRRISIFHTTAEFDRSRGIYMAKKAAKIHCLNPIYMYEFFCPHPSLTLYLPLLFSARDGSQISRAANFPTKLFPTTRKKLARQSHSARKKKYSIHSTHLYTSIPPKTFRLRCAASGAVKPRRWPYLTILFRLPRCWRIYSGSRASFGLRHSRRPAEEASSRDSLFLIYLHSRVWEYLRSRSPAYGAIIPTPPPLPFFFEKARRAGACIMHASEGCAILYAPGFLCVCMGGMGVVYIVARRRISVAI